jgi:small subunit ribosomal protein S20
MPNLPSAKKHVRADARKRERNRRVKSSTRTAVRKARTALSAQAGDAADAVRLAVSALDKAAKKGVIKKGTADRTKSRLMRLHNSAAVP